MVLVLCMLYTRREIAWKNIQTRCSILGPQLYDTNLNALLTDSKLTDDLLLTDLS